MYSWNISLFNVQKLAKSKAVVHKITYSILQEWSFNMSFYETSLGNVQLAYGERNNIFGMSFEKDFMKMTSTSICHLILYIWPCERHRYYISWNEKTANIG